MPECSRSREIFSYLVDAGAPEAAGIRDHVSDCASCGELMGRLLAIEEGLSMEYEFEDDMEHPTSEKLLAFRRDRDLSPADRSAIESHIGSCAKCESELSSLSSFDFARAAVLAREGRESAEVADAATTAAAATEGGSSDSIWSGLREWFASFDGMVSAPAYALALLLIFVPVAVYTFVNQDDGSSGSGENLAVNQTAEDGLRAESRRPLDDSNDGKVQIRDLRGNSLAVESLADLDGSVVDGASDSASDPLPAHTDSVEIFGGDVALESAPADALLDDSIRDGESAAPVGEVILLAALDQWSMPQYRAPGNLDPFDSSPILVRASDGASDSIPRVLAPNHVAETLHESPTLYWALDKESSAGVEITLVREKGGDVVLEYTEPGPTVAGLHAIPLENHGVGLEVGSEYRMYVSLVVDPKRRSRDRRGSGAIRRVAPPSDLSSATQSADSIGHAYASLGLWVDAAQFFVELSEKSPDSEKARILRDQFLDEVATPPSQ